MEDWCPSQLQPAIASQDGLGQGGLRLKWAKGRSGSKIDEKMKVLRMNLPIAENRSGPQESIFNLFRGPQLNSRKKTQKLSNFITFPHYPYEPTLGQWLFGALGCVFSRARHFAYSGTYSDK